MNNQSRIITQRMLEDSVTLDEKLIEIIQDAFITLAKDPAITPQIQQIPMDAVNGQVCVKSAYVPKLPYFVVKIAGIFPNNNEINEQSNQGCMCLFDSTSGKLDTLLADNGLLTQLRTAASGAVAAKFLAPKSGKYVAVIGAGVQAKLQLKALALVSNFESVSIFSRTTEKADILSDWVKDHLKKDSKVSQNIAEALADAEIIITTTGATDHLINPSHLNLNKPVHITAMGSDSPRKNELSPELYSLASRYVCDLKSQSLCLGELRTVAATGEVDFTKVEELGEVCAQQSFRREEDTLSICDLTGVGILDLAIASYARNMA